MRSLFRNRVIYARISIVLIVSFGLGVLAVGTFRGDNSVFSYFELKKSRTNLEATVADLEKQNRELTEEITRLKKSKSYARKVLRDKYHVMDPDENIMFFAD